MDPSHSDRSEQLEPPHRHSYEWGFDLNVQRNKYRIFVNCGNTLNPSWEKVRQFGLSVEFLSELFPSP